jgi:predicted amidohydrolase
LIFLNTIAFLLKLLYFSGIAPRARRPSMSRPLPIALAQFSPSPIDAPFDEFAHQAQGIVNAFPGVRLIAFPELHLFGSDLDPAREERLHEAAEPAGGPRVRALTELAGDLGIWLVPGSICERGPNSELFNTSLVLSPQGGLVASYRKMFPWRPYEPFDPGDRFVVADLPGTGRIGLSICYDSWFPEVTRHLAWMGAEAIINVVKTTTSDRAQELVLARANAIVNQVFMVSVNCAGPVGTGQSLVVDPEGRVRVSSSDACETVLTDVIDFDAVTVVRDHGTAGLNRVWSQFRDTDSPISLPLYDGRIDPATWPPATTN